MASQPTWMLISPLAHIAGVPVEETALMFAPMWSAVALIVGVRVRRRRARERRLRGTTRDAKN
jgi:hypothetical protein